MLAPTIGHNSPLRSVLSPKARLLLIADSTGQLNQLKAGIKSTNVEITGVSSLEELRAACRNHHDLVVVNVHSSQIQPALSTLRLSAGHANIPVLVESSRLQDNLNLAGVLPAFRAMACSQAELVMLTRFYCEDHRKPEEPRSVLL